MNDFIQPSENINNPNSLEWMHFANISKENIQKRWEEPTGKGLFNALVRDRFSKNVIEKNVGKFAGKYDLRGIDLSNQNLENLDLSDVDFFASNFSDSNCKAANFSNSHLSECNICGTCFEWAIFNETFLDHVKFDKRTSFVGVDLHKINFTLATLLYDLALTQQRISELEKNHKIFARFLRWTCDYGRSFLRYILWVTVFIVSYAVIYFSLMDKSFLDCLYFSVVTFATVGYGDILPITPLEKIIVVTEIMIGYLMGGLLIAILAKRVIG